MHSKQRNNRGLLLAYATLAARTLRDLAPTGHTPLLQTVTEASLVLLNEIEKTNTNERILFDIVELVHQLLCAIVRLSLGEHVLPVKWLVTVEDFVNILRNIHIAVQTHRELSKIQRFLRQQELGARLRAYDGELQAALEVFSKMNGGGLSAELIELELDAQQRHQHLVALLAAEGDIHSVGDSASGHRSEYDSISQFSASDSITSVLPPFPKIFHGRDSELELIVSNLKSHPAHIAVLGPGGMGKTTLAVAALHHPDITSLYEQRYFVSCESASNKAQLVNLIGARLGLEASKLLSKSIIDSFLVAAENKLLVLDNFETPWEGPDGRAEVEEFLSQLSEVPQLSLLVTMRGAERPANVKWARPFLPALEPLHPSASRQTFIDIADDPAEDEEQDLTELIGLAGNLPLAVSLMAAVASYEGYTNTLRRWKLENTALLSDGYDTRSNLNSSIAVSLSSPRMASSPGAKDLLSLLSLLPDGISDADLLSRRAVVIPNVLQCRTALLRISLTHMDHGRLKALSPIRHYMQHAHPPSHEAVERLRNHWGDILELWTYHKATPCDDLVSGLTSNAGNIASLTELALSRRVSGGERQRLMHNVLSLDLFSDEVLKGTDLWTHHVVDDAQLRVDRRLHLERICSRLNIANLQDLAPGEAEKLIQQGIRHY
ncbi:P-loop containing nucleoside triphosphate hydrolase protein, partial [Mycena filopes]